MPPGEVAPATRSESGTLVGPAKQIGILRFGPRQAIQALVEQQASGETDGETVGNVADDELQRVAVNLSDAGESDLRPRIELGSNELKLAGAGRRSLWFYLSLAALGLIVGEWFLYQRRIVG